MIPQRVAPEIVPPQRVVAEGGPTVRWTRRESGPAESDPAENEHACNAKVRIRAKAWLAS